MRFGTVNGGVPNHFGIQTTRTTTTEEESKKPTMDEVIAMALCYRRLAFVLGAAPVLVAVTPLLVKTALGVVNFVTKGYGNASFVLTGLLTWIWYVSLKSAAPTPEKLQDAYQKSQGRLPLLMFFGSCGFLRFIVGIAHVEEDSARPNLLQWTPDIAWGVGLGPAFGLTLVGLAVLLRLVGPSSIGTYSLMHVCCVVFQSFVSATQLPFSVLIDSLNPFHCPSIYQYLF